MAKYLPRVIDSILDEYLEAFGAILIRGPKWCGKTTTAKQRASSVLQMQDPDNFRAYLDMANFMPSRLLEGDTPRLIDEWQMAPVLWDAVRSAVDERQKVGQFILTGSTVIGHDQILHTGTGRIVKIDMKPMSLFESNESNGTVSLNSLFFKQDFTGSKSDLTVEQLVFSICRGGWPASIGLKERAALLIAKSYVEAICTDDARRIDASISDPERVRAILRSYARNLSTLASNRSILKDISTNDLTMNESTLYRYLTALNSLFVIQDIPAWNPSIRSSTSIRSTNKKGFVDPSIAAAALALTPSQLLDDLQTLGFFFESLCIRDLQIYASEQGGEISYYRDRYGLECDIVLHLDNGSYALIEAKLGSSEIDEASKNLIKLKGLIGEKKLRQPEFLMVLTAGQYAYKRTDDVLVVPIGCLKP
ncbi:MAG: DUF4143 domain-containing protein [Anaerolineaceae bacterium]|nr:DUF4143 domain-containing protein [Anaerolineaceae bacterium]